MDNRTLFEFALRQHQQGNLEVAGESYRRFLSEVPGHPEALHLLGVLTDQNGNSSGGIELIEKAIAANKKNPDYFSNIASIYNKVGRHKDAEKACRRAIKINSRHDNAFNNLGIAMESLERPSEAARAYKRAIQLNPQHIDAQINLGVINRDLGELKAAADNFKKAISIDSQNPMALMNLGAVLSEMGEIDEAEKVTRQALEIAPQSAPINNTLGLILRITKRFDEAIAVFKKALEIDPIFEQASFNLGASYAEANRHAEAEKLFTNAFSNDPSNFQFGLALAKIYMSQSKFDDAKESFEALVVKFPEAPEALLGLAEVLLHSGDYLDAREFFKKHYDLTSSTGSLISSVFTLPVINHSNEEIESVRTLFFDEINELRKRGIQLEDPVQGIRSTIFYLAYQNHNDLEIQTAVSEFYRTISEPLNFTADFKLRNLDSRKVIRVGFISEHFFRHTIGWLYRNLIRDLPRDRFEIFLIRTATEADELTKEIEEYADSTLVVPNDLKTAQELITELRLDVLFYADIGMKIFTYFLAHARLAPVQAVGWGHPVTTGISTIDYFVSSELIEPENAQDHYRETLVLLPGILTNFTQPEQPVNLGSRDGFDLPSAAHWYVYPQSIFKIHPDFDIIVGKILASDRQACVIFTGSKSEKLEHKLRERLFQNIDNTDRIKILPPMVHDEFLRLMGAAEAIIDVPQFSGGNTTLECFAMLAPVVTLPGEYMRGRVTAGYYREMQMTDLIAENEDEYVKLAVKLANDSDFRNMMREKLKRSWPLVFENQKAIEQFAGFLESAVENSVN